MKGLDLIQELMEIRGSKAKEKFIVENLDNREFVEIMKFVLDDNIVTNVDIKKWNKVEYELFSILDVPDMYDIFKFAKSDKCTGKNDDIIKMKMFANKYEDSYPGLFGKILTKTLKTGVTKKTWNKVVPDEHKIDIVPYMGCKAYSEKLIDKMFKENEYIFSQVKEDGAFLNYIDRLTYMPKIISRNGKIQEYGSSSVMYQMSMSGLFVGKVVMGELLIDSIYDRAKANGILRQLDYFYMNKMKGESKDRPKVAEKFRNEFGCFPKEMSERIIYKVWDIVPVDEFGKGVCNKSYVGRYKELQNLVSMFDDGRLKLVDTKVVTNKEQAMTHLSECLQNGLEGTVLKSPHGIFKDSKPDWQIKMKVEFTLDLEIIGYKEGKIGTKNEGKIGSIICKTSDGILKCSPNGFTESQEKEIRENWDSNLSKIVEVKCNGLSKGKDGVASVFYPKFVQIRDDKDVANSYQECIEIQNSALGLKEKIN